jgi:hypothetical protein
MRTVTPPTRSPFARCAAFLLAITTWPASGIAVGGLVPQHSEDLRPALTRSSKGDAATLAFTAFRRDFRLQLSRNERLAKLAAGSSLELYEGTLERAPGSWVRISVQDGLPRGVIWDGRELFVVDAAPAAVNDGAAGTVVFKLSDAVLERAISFGDDAVEKPRDAADAFADLLGDLRATAVAAPPVAATQSVDISVLGDAAYRARYASDTQAREATLARLNIVDGIFASQVGVQLEVVSINVAGELTGGLSATTASSTLLEELSQLRQQTAALSATGLTHLFTGRELDGNSAGIAYTEALCSRRFSASLAMAHNSATLDALITAHEIGHVFGAPHDGVEQCAATPQNQYIMTPTLNTSVSSFSQCSVDEINAVRASYSCLVALPTPAPTPTPTPAPPTPPPGGGSSGGGGGGGGSVDPLLLIALALVTVAGRRPTRREPA